MHTVLYRSTEEEEEFDLVVLLGTRAEVTKVTPRTDGYNNGLYVIGG